MGAPPAGEDQDLESRGFLDDLCDGDVEYVVTD